MNGDSKIDVVVVSHAPNGHIDIIIIYGKMINWYITILDLIQIALRE